MQTIKNNLKQLLILACLIMLLILPYFVFAQTAPLEGLNNIREASGFAENEDPEFAMAATIGIIIKAFLSILGIIFIVLILYAGYNWMMAQDEEEKINKAKHTIQRAIIGLIIIIGAYAIWNFVYFALLDI